jgi:hypothetical protein
VVRRSGWRRPQRRGSIGDGALGVAVGSTRHVRTSACRPPCRRGGHPTLSQTQIEWSQAHTPRRLLVEWGQALRDVHESSRVFKVRSRFPATGVGACACSPVRDPLAFCPCGTRRWQAAIASKFYAAHPASKELGTRTGALPSRRRSLTKYRVHTARTRLEAHTWKSGSQHAVDETPRCAPAAPSSTRAVGAVLIKYGDSLCRRDSAVCCRRSDSAVKEDVRFADGAQHRHRLGDDGPSIAIFLGMT